MTAPNDDRMMETSERKTLMTACADRQELCSYGRNEEGEESQGAEWPRCRAAAGGSPWSAGQLRAMGCLLSGGCGAQAALDRWPRSV